jgi:hypothetical protein
MKLFRADLHVLVDELTFKLVEQIVQATSKSRNQLITEFIHFAASSKYPDIFKTVSNQKVRLALAPEERNALYVSPPVAGFTSQPHLEPDTITKPPDPIVEVEETDEQKIHRLLGLK